MTFFSTQLPILLGIFLCFGVVSIPATASIDHTLVRKAGLVAAGLLITHTGLELIREKDNPSFSKIIKIGSGIALLAAGLCLICTSHELIHEIDIIIGNS